MQVITGILSLALVFANSCQSKARTHETEHLLIEAVVEKLGENPGVGSGIHAVYQLAKYKVTSVCEGEYDRPTIIVDHLLLEGSELKELQIGDRVRVVIRRSKTIFVRNNEEGFREAADKVDEFYIGGKPTVIPDNCKSCEACM